MPRSHEPDTCILRAAETCLSCGETEKALAELGRIAPEHRARAEVLRLRTRIHAQARQWEHVVVVAGTLARMYPHEAFGAVHYSDALRRLGRFEEAIDFLLPIAQEQPTEPWPAFHLACALCQTGDLDPARLWLERALRRAAIPEELRDIAWHEPDLHPLWPLLHESASPRMNT
jgi:Flp pilus assembly protein TadD